MGRYGIDKTEPGSAGRAPVRGSAGCAVSLGSGRAAAGAVGLLTRRRLVMGSRFPDAAAGSPR